MPEYHAHAPIYVQIVMDIKRAIISGAWHPGERIDSVRELAASFRVNPNTMQRAMSALEQEGLIYTERTSGRFVTADEALISKARHEMAAALTQNTVSELMSMGYNINEIEELVRSFTKNLQ